MTRELSVLELVSACEYRLKALDEEVRRVGTEPHRYRQMSVELRVLVCRTRTNEPLLLNLMTEYGVEYSIFPEPDLPFPIPMIGDFDEARDVMTMAPEDQDALLARQIAAKKPVALVDFVERALAMFIRSHEVSYRDLILALADQEGAHQDLHADARIEAARHVVIGGQHTAEIASLISLASHVVAAGVDVIRAAAKRDGYRPKFVGG
jgi:hypothetical protein